MDQVARGEILALAHLMMVLTDEITRDRPAARKQIMDRLGDAWKGLPVQLVDPPGQLEAGNAYRSMIELFQRQLKAPEQL